MSWPDFRCPARCAALGVRGGERRRIEQLIVVFAVFAFAARLQFDIGAGEQRAQPGDTFTTDLRLHHPEGGVLTQQFLHAGIETRLHHHLAQIIAQRDGFHHADVHAAAFDFGFTRFQPFRRRGDQRHHRPLMAEVVKQDPAPISAVTMGMIHTGDQRLIFSTSATL